MKLRTAGYTVAGILMGVLMGGCSSTGTDQSGSPAVETKTTVQPIKTEAETQPVPQTVVAEPDPLTIPPACWRIASSTSTTTVRSSRGRSARRGSRKLPGAESGPADPARRPRG